MHLMAPQCGSAPLSPGGWKSQSSPGHVTTPRTPRPCSSGSGGNVQRQPLHLLHAVAGVGMQVPTPTSPSPSPSPRGGATSTSYGGAARSPSPRAVSAPLQILIRAAAEARVAGAAPAELSEVAPRLSSTQSWPALQVLALQYQGRLDQPSVVAVLRRAAQLAPGGASPTSSEQYACARFLESMAMSCASLIPSMTPATVANVLGSLGTLAGSGLVVLRQVPYMVVVLVQALILASLPQLHFYTGPQLAYALRGCAMLSPSGLPEVWLDEWQTVTTGPVLAAMPPEALEAVVASLQTLYTRQNWLPQDPWLGELLQVVESNLNGYDGRGLRHLAVALAGLEVRPHEGWLGSFRNTFNSRVASADMAPHDVAGVLYAFTKLEVAFS
ncbi:hypothetical protein TSOC_001362 [Tetrabaena socialis]|uniref:Uncharacterized protein n=1 Tax=Tetrabaena socialis TaxID=47790 RepID=A0A2J8AGW7_9CHLO|nr:hypothetical protein TSOC_001362 [Tetrabaena socialis]|eukprot:PNH11765.1 hypothetical protein TSOC_001362 [Tetrabaena socialis]